MSGKIPSVEATKPPSPSPQPEGKYTVSTAKTNGPRALTHSELTAAAEATGGIYFENRSVALLMLECTTTLCKKYNANNENPKLIYLLGLAYSNGCGVKKNPLKAIICFTRAAKLGDSGAQINLGLSYIYGEGVEKNLEKGLKYLTRAADNGNMNAQYQLGYQYSIRPELPNNLERSAHYARLAADQGHPGGQYNLGVCFKHGDGVDKDLKQAEHYFELAAAQNHQDAIRALKIMAKVNELS